MSRLGGLYLLQQVFFESSGDRFPWMGPVITVVFVGASLFVLIMAVRKNRKNVPPASRFSIFTLYKIARDYGLDTPQRKLLAAVFREDLVADPLSVMADPVILDVHFKRAFRRIRDSGADGAAAEDMICQLFALRNAIEAVHNTTGGGHSTTGAAGSNGAAGAKNQVHRRWRRREISLPCTLGMITVREQKVHRKIIRKMSLDGRSYQGTIKDISIGGCAIQTAADIAPGARLKIAFAEGKSKTVAALAQVLRVNRKGIHATIHTKFSKIPRGSYNALNALVYAYNEGSGAPGDS